MKDECLICGAALEYLNEDAVMKCALCGREEASKTRCMAGHYVCSECHTKGIDSIIGICLSETSSDPTRIIEKLMSQPFCHMHGPEHHILVGSALLTAYKNAGGNIDLRPALIEMQNRGKNVPGGACGFWGACGAGISTGMFISIVTKATPLAKEAWGLANSMTAAALGKIGETGGPRCCKRNSKLAIMAAVDFTGKHFGVSMKKSKTICDWSEMNNQCIGKRCPFFKAKDRVKIKIKSKEI